MQSAVRPGWLVPLGFLLFVGGCVGPFSGLRSPGLEDAQEVAERYGSELRWGRFNEAAALVHPDLRPRFQRLMAGQEDRLRITSVEVEAVDLSTDGLSGNALVRYRLYRLPAVVEESRSELLRLRRGLSGSWFVEPNLRELSNDLGIDPDRLAP
jgi:hypothetical protein